MRKFKLLASSMTRANNDVDQQQDVLRQEHFRVSKIIRHGFPCHPTALACDPVQRLVAIGTRTGLLRIFGRQGVDVSCEHEGGPAVLHIIFLINEGALISATSDDQLHLWNIRQRTPALVHTLKFQKERVTCVHLPVQSKWLYVGTSGGNVHVVNVETFTLSGYVINWNKLIELSQKTRPGSIIHLSDCPIDSNKLLIGFETGQMVLWDVKGKCVDQRFSYCEPLKSVSWHHEGKQFICSHCNGSLTVWGVRTSQKPQRIICPHAKSDENCSSSLAPIGKVEWLSAFDGDTSYTIFSGGTVHGTSGLPQTLTVVRDKSTTLVQMEGGIVDFVTFTATPWMTGSQDPYAIVVLQRDALSVVDLKTTGYPLIENPYAMDLHESAVTAAVYVPDCPSDVIPALYSVGAKQMQQRRATYSTKNWPVTGGSIGSTACSYSELFITGHADGLVKF